MILFRLAWVLAIGIPVALILFTLAMEFGVTIIEIHVVDPDGRTVLAEWDGRY